MKSDKEMIHVSIGNVRKLVMIAGIWGYCINTILDPFIPEGNISLMYYLLVLLTFGMLLYLLVEYRDVLNQRDVK